MPITSRPAEEVADLSAAVDLLSRAWLEDGPKVAQTPGDLEWWFAQSYPAELPELLQLWYADGELAAWSWRSGPDDLDWHVARDHREAGLEDTVLGWLVEQGTTGNRTTTLKAWAAEYDPGRVACLDRHGFRATDELMTQWCRRLDDGRRIGAPTLPTGYTIRTVHGPADIAQRVEVHRQAFAPSRLTEDKYRRLMTLPHYRPEHDIVAVAPDGSLAAFTMAWWDPIGRVGELEPVGTHPHHRRLGLARATVQVGLHLFQVLGASWAEVYSETSNAASEALYASAGFEVLAYDRRYVRGE